MNKDLEEDAKSIDRAIEAARETLKHIILGPPLIKRGPRGEIHIDIPILYNGYALDRIHFNPYASSLSPKGRSVHAYDIEVDEKKIRAILEKVKDELEVIEAVEYREPEDAWAVPIKWNRYIVAHLKISRERGEIIPDYPLTEEVRRHVL